MKTLTNYSTDESIIENIRLLKKENIKEILQFQNDNQLKLFSIARKIRNDSIYSNKAELRSVIELSNICSQKCNYCSICKNDDSFFQLSKEVILDKIKLLINKGRRVFLLQSGENKSNKFIENIAYCCKKALEINSDIKIILCLGNLSYDQYKLLKDSGAQRYILKFETSNPKHHIFCRPTDTIENRLKHINILIEMGFKTGSGNIIGLPGQTLDNLIEDLVLIDKLKLSMVSATRFIPNESSAFAKYPYGNLNLTLNFLAILRILKPNCLIPTTSSLSIDKSTGQAKGLLAGCNTVTIHDGTPTNYAEKFSIYSQKRFSPEEEYCRNIIKDADMLPTDYLI